MAFAVVAGLAAPARADETEAEKAFAEGRELLERGTYAEACEAFARSQRLDPALGTLLNLGLCHERLGQLATSHAKFRAAADLAAREDDETRKRVAQERAKALEPRLIKLKIELEGTPPPGLEVAVDDRDVTRELGEAHPVDPGRYELEVAAPGRQAWQRTIRLFGEGTTEIVTVPELEEKPDDAGTEAREPEGESARDGAGAAPPGPEPPGPPEAPSGRGQGWRVGGMTTAGAGVVAAATGLAFGLHARSTWRRSKDYCDGDRVCSSRGSALAARAERSADLSTLLVGAGVAAAATGALLWLTAPSSDPASPSSSARVVPEASRESMGVSIRGRF